MVKVLESYTIEVDKVELEVNIVAKEDEFVRIYNLSVPEFGAGTKALLNDLKNRIITEARISPERSMDARFVAQLKEEFSKKARAALDHELPSTPPKVRDVLVGILMQQMLGIGEIEFLLSDGDLEEIVVNSSREPIWVYHKKYGWLKTNITIETEADIQNYASIIARRVGKQITTLAPLLDAHLVSGDRANATLQPISTHGNTITIRRFRRDPWTITDFINAKTVNSEVMALVWLAIEYEMNVIVSGGTGSGKTSFLNVCMPFIQPNQRILSIEDTRELQLPDYLHWVPMTTREPNPEGKGGVSMLDLLVNSLRMRPDRIIVGESRRQREAEVMFEAMHTGHSVYTTVHANTAAETIRRLVNPPIEIPPTMLDSVHLNVVMFRNRRLGTRRALQVAEFISEKAGGDKEESLKPNILYRWRPAGDVISKYSESVRLFDELNLHTGLSPGELNRELKLKKAVLDWMVKFDIRKINDVGKVMAEYYLEPEEVVKFVVDGRRPDFLVAEEKAAGEKLEAAELKRLEEAAVTALKGAQGFPAGPAGVGAGTGVSTMAKGGGPAKAGQGLFGLFKSKPPRGAAGKGGWLWWERFGCVRVLFRCS